MTEALSLSPVGLALLKRFEGCRLEAYLPTPDDVPTIGWGATFHADGRRVTLGEHCTQAEADALLGVTLADDARRLTRLLAGAATTQPQFDALLLLGYNIGMAALGRATLFTRHRAGDHAAAAAGFAAWRFAKGRELPGLVARRAAEAARYRAAR